MVPPALQDCWSAGIDLVEAAGPRIPSSKGKGCNLCGRSCWKNGRGLPPVKIGNRMMPRMLKQRPTWKKGAGLRWWPGVAIVQSSFQHAASLQMAQKSKSDKLKWQRRRMKRKKGEKRGRNEATRGRCIRQSLGLRSKAFGTAGAKKPEYVKRMKAVALPATKDFWLVDVSNKNKTAKCNGQPYNTISSKAASFKK